MRSRLRAPVVWTVVALAGAHPLWVTVVLAGAADVFPAVAPPGADLRSACSAGAEPIARLEAGTKVEIRFAVAGDPGTCYKVQAGERLGYLLAAELGGIEAFERGRRSAPGVEMPRMVRAEIGRLKGEGTTGSSGAGGTAVAEVLELIETNQPREALGRLEAGLLRSASQDPFVLSLAGLAAYQSDRLEEALEYWSRSLAIRPNPAIETLVDKARREMSADRNRDRLSSNRFILRYDAREIASGQAARMLDALTEEYGRIDLGLGCGLQEQVIVIVETVDAYRAATGAADWSGGQFDGRIRVVLAERTMTAGARQALVHELVHACLARQGRFPLWFHEGMAQRWSGERSTPARISAVKARLRSKQMPDLEHMSPVWMRMSGEHARLGYAQSLAAVEVLYERYGEQYVRGLIRDPAAVEQTAGRLNRLLESN